MLDKLKDSLEKIKNSEEFSKRKSEQPKSYLSSAFLDVNNWQFHYYNPSDSKVAVFVVENDVVSINIDEIFKKEGNEIKELHIEDIKIDNVSELIKKLIDEKYSSEEETKKIIILQQTEYPIWNITYVTKALNVLHVKLNAISGEIIEEKFESIMKFKGK